MPHEIEPLFDHVLVFDMDRKMMVDGIELPDNIRQQDMVAGKVLSVGKGCVAVEPDNVILYGPYAGKNVLLDGVELRLLKEGQIEARIREKVNS